jgi:flavin-dependent dehydrogenase
VRLAPEVGGAAVAGGGPAGATAALLLARAGRAVTLVERDAAPAHKVCGEFVGGDGLARLAALGINVASLGAHSITRMRLIRGAHAVETTLPFAAVGLSRRTLDSALLGAAEAAGATVLRGHAIRALRGGRLEVQGLGAMPAAPLFLATGKHELRGATRAIDHAATETVGFKLHLTLAPEQARAVSGTIELILFRDTYAGLQPIEGGLANLCLVTPQSRLAACGGWEGLLASLSRENPHLARRLEGATGWPKPLAIARVPYGFVHDAGAAPDDGGYRLGDQMGVIHSFTGDGIAIALHTASLAAACFLAGGSPAAYHARARADVRGPIRLASVLYRSGRSAVLQAAMMGVARLWPGVLGRMAGLTRAGWACGG